jgi:NAD(P)-dependent dehydrogenase (short-subunit alcohol dehydrogenase family)
MPNWSTADIPRQTGRLVAITGATGGLGLETALALAGAGADVMLTGRNAQKGAAALATIRARHPAASVRYGHLDLASLASAREFAGQFAQAHAALDLLINNAGVMMPPKRQTTSDGFELQFGTNYLGHFALTERLLPLLRAARQPRVVNLSSIAHKNGAAIHFDDLQWQRGYKPWSAYGQSKLAMLRFALELQRRSDANGWGLLNNAAHPGYVLTDLIANGRGADGLLHALNRLTLEPLLSQSAADGALPTLFAATAPNAKAAGYCGPTGFFELKGPPGAAQIARPARDQAAAARLWQISEALTIARSPSAIEEQAS